MGNPFSRSGSPKSTLNIDMATTQDPEIQDLSLKEPLGTFSSSKK
jgi:hypothetical protein